jgi:hypothetical protein
VSRTRRECRLPACPFVTDPVDLVFLFGSSFAIPSQLYLRPSDAVMITASAAGKKSRSLVCIAVIVLECFVETEDPDQISTRKSMSDFDGVPLPSGCRCFLHLLIFPHDCLPMLPSARQNRPKVVVVRRYPAPKVTLENPMVVVVNILVWQQWVERGQKRRGMVGSEEVRH